MDLYNYSDCKRCGCYADVKRGCVLCEKCFGEEHKAQKQALIFIADNPFKEDKEHGKENEPIVQCLMEMLESLEKISNQLDTRTT